MTDNEKLVRAKAILGLTSNTNDTLIGGYITDAGYLILSITGQSTVPAVLEGAQVDIAVSMYSKRGAEGEGSHSEGGVSVTYESLSPMLQALLRSQTLARVVDMNASP
jgi:hypothetical protein